MNEKIKKGILGGVIFLLSFLVVTGIVYLIYPILDPETAGKVDRELQGKGLLLDGSASVLSGGSSLMVQDSVEGDEDLQAAEDSLQSLLEPGFRERENRYLATIDSLKNVIAEVQARYENSVAAAEKNASSEVESMTKALMNLDVEELSPILNRLQMKQLLKVYQFASNMQREKLLRALEPEKASGILIQVMS